MTDRGVRTFHLVTLVCVGLCLGYLWGRLVLPGCSWDCYPAHQAIVDGTASSPYRYRVLTPMVVETVSGLLPIEDAELRVNAAYLLGHLLALPSMLLALYAWLQRSTTRGRAFAGCLLVGAYMPLAFITAGAIHLYTIVEVAIVALALWLISSDLPRRDQLYALLTVLAVLNRETGLYLILLYAAIECHEPGFTRRMVLVTAVGISTYGLVTSLLGYTAHDVTLPYLLEINQQYMASNVLHNLLLVPFALAAVEGWSTAHPVLRRLLVFSLPYAFAVLVFGQWFESRLWFPLFPVLLAVGLHAQRKESDVRSRSADHAPGGDPAAARGGADGEGG